MLSAHDCPHCERALAVDDTEAPALTFHCDCGRSYYGSVEDGTMVMEGPC